MTTATGAGANDAPRAYFVDPKVEIFDLPRLEAALNVVGIALGHMLGDVHQALDKASSDAEPRALTARTKSGAEAPPGRWSVAAARLG